MSDPNDISALLNSVLNDEPEDATEPATPAPPEPDANCITEANGDCVTEEPCMYTSEETGAVIMDGPADYVLDIESIIADATGESEPEPEPEPETDMAEAKDDSVHVDPETPAPEVTQVCDTQPVFSKGAGDDAIPLPTFTSDEVMDALDIRNFGTLVTLRTARWHAKIKDRKAAKDAEAARGATAGAFEAQKLLLAGADEKLKRVHKAIDSARTAHYTFTLPWSTVAVNEQGKRAGSRLLPNSLFMEYTTAMATAKQEMEDSLAEFVQDYPKLITIAQQKLGSAFNQTEYPPSGAIGQHFDLAFDFDPIPKGSDFDGLQDQQAKALGDALNRKTRTMLENAMQDAWVRLFETVQHAHVKLSNPDAMFHYTMIDKLREQATMLAHLNATSDPRIEEVRVAVEKKLTLHDVKDIRKDDALRKKLSADAQEIFERMKEIADATP